MLKVLICVLLVAAPVQAAAQSQSGAGAAPEAGAGTRPTVPVSPDYVIGPEDVLGVVFWREQDLTSEVKVRPDGKVSLPLLNDVQAAGLTPSQLRDKITTEAKRFIEDPTVAIVVKEINSRRVFVMGEVQRPGPYPLVAPTSVLQMIATAGGLKEFADDKHILIMRTVGGHQISFAFNYRDVSRRKNLAQNILLEPGDTIVVP
jgi:polysaccharide export outer membrane protein